MGRRRWIRGAAMACVALGALCAAAVDASAHGGGHGEPPPPPFPPAPVPGGIPAPTPGPTPGGTPTPRNPPPGTPTPGSGGTPTGIGRGRGVSSSPSDWEDWWKVHKERFLRTRERLRARMGAASGGGIGATLDTGDGNVAAGGDPLADARAGVTSTLQSLLRDKDSDVRGAALIALGKLGANRAFHDMIKLRTDDVKDVRESVVLGLGLLGEPLAVEEMRRVLFNRDEDAKIRAMAAVSLGLLGGEESADMLLAFLSPSADAGVVGGLRRSDGILDAAAAALGRTGHGEVAEPFRELYAAPTLLPRRTRAFASVSLARLGDRASLPLFLQATRADREELRAGAAAALGIYGAPADDAVVEALARLTREDRDPVVRRQAGFSLAAIGGPAAHAALQRWLARGSAEDQPFAILAGAVSGDPEAGAQFLSIFRSVKNPEIRSVAALAMGILGYGEGAADIRKATLESRAMRARGLEALGMLGDRESLEPVREMLADKRDPISRLEAARCLVLLGDPSVLTAVVDMAGEASGSYLRMSACDLLGVAGDLRAVEALTTFATDPGQQDVVRIHAVAALGNLLDRDIVPRLATFAMGDVLPYYELPLRQVLSLL